MRITFEMKNMKWSFQNSLVTTRSYWSTKIWKMASEPLRSDHRRAPLLLERTQVKIRARGMLKVLSTESYRTDSRIRLGTGAYRRRIPFPSPAYPHHSQEGANQPHDQSTY